MKHTLSFALLLTLCVHLAVSAPARETEIEDTPETDKRGIFSDVGNKVIGGFDRVVYGLMDEAMQYVTDDKKGAFKEMLVRHRGDLYENIRKNLIHKDKITLSDVKATVMGEINNRFELFNYVGGGLWKKISGFSTDLFSQYKGHCDKNPDKLYCFNKNNDAEKKRNSEFDTFLTASSSSSSNDLEREDGP